MCTYKVFNLAWNSSNTGLSSGALELDQQAILQRGTASSSMAEVYYVVVVPRVLVSRRENTGPKLVLPPSHERRLDFIKI